MAAEITPAKLEKLRIEAFQNETYTGSPQFVFTTAVNPDKYTLGLKIELSEKKTINGIDPTQYVRTPPAEIDFEFLFDDTGLIGSDVSFTGTFKSVTNPLVPNDINADPASNITGVEANIQRFLQVVYNYDGQIHKPNYLRIIWGTLVLSCILSDLSLEYKLFAPNGKPLRAVAKAKFKSFMDAEKIAGEQQQNSPDLTHVRIVEEGDTLPLMTQRIYGDSKYYLEVARVNKITTFRELRAGTRIYFPPIQKPG